jgi:hypothetical protein
MVVYLKMDLVLLALYGGILTLLTSSYQSVKGMPPGLLLSCLPLGLKCVVYSPQLGSLVLLEEPAMLGFVKVGATDRMNGKAFLSCQPWQLGKGDQPRKRRRRYERNIFEQEFEVKDEQVCKRWNR